MLDVLEYYTETSGSRDGPTDKFIAIQEKKDGVLSNSFLILTLAAGSRADLKV